MGHDAISVVELGLSGADDVVVRPVAIEQDRILVTLDADFANVVRFPPAHTPGVVRLRIHPAVEAAVDEALRFGIPRLAGINLAGKLVVIDERKIRVRG